jgi:hypothetical protein
MEPGRLPDRLVIGNRDTQVLAPRNSCATATAARQARSKSTEIATDFR